MRQDDRERMIADAALVHEMNADAVHHRAKLREPIDRHFLTTPVERMCPVVDEGAQLTVVGDWEAWLDFFLEGVADTATSAVDTAQRLVALFKEDTARVQAAGRGAATMLRVLQSLHERPVITLRAIATLRS